MRKTKMKHIVVPIISIIMAAFFAIFVHAVMPSPGGAVNTEDFNSMFVELVGFPIAESYPIQVLVWTGIFGIVMGFAYTLLVPLYENKQQKKSIIEINLVTVGLNWVIFNSFIGFILKDTILGMIRRSIIDVVAVCFAALILNWILPYKKVIK